ncbi:hypothetical protein [Bdellovibrio sp. BCCA]|uniref:hypothetical protein n=1 Tax=Bdellovibrio sp. BCCA TaxID=3136281 RepID=UPI0030F02758
MAQKEYLLRINGKVKSLMIEWGWFSNTLTVSLEKETLGVLKGWKGITKGNSFSLDDGSSVTVRWQMGSSTPYVSHGDQILDGTSESLQESRGAGYGLLAFLGVLNLLMGIAVVFGLFPSLKLIGMGYYNLFSGAFYSVCAIVGWEDKRRSCIKWGFGFFLFETVHMLLQGLINPTAIFVRAMFIHAFYKALKHKDEKVQRTPSALAPSEDRKVG